MDLDDVGILENAKYKNRLQLTYLLFGWMSCVMCAPLYSMSLDPHRLEASWAKVGSELGLQGRGEGRKE